MQDRANVHRIDSFNELASRITQFGENNQALRTAIMSAANSRLSEAQGLQGRMESRRSMVAADLARAQDEYQRCIDRHRDDEDCAACCLNEKHEVTRLANILEKIEECCSKGRQLVSEAQTHRDNIETMVNMLNGSIDPLCSGASSALHSLSGKTHEYLAVKSSVEAIGPIRNTVQVRLQSNESLSESVSSSNGTPAAVEIFRLPDRLADRYVLDTTALGQRAVIYNRDRSERIARFSCSSDRNAAIMSVFSIVAHADDGVLNDLELFLKAGGFSRYSFWSEKDETEHFVRRGFTVREETVSLNGCVVEKVLTELKDTVCQEDQ
jgi:hypothetical protein